MKLLTVLILCASVSMGFSSPAAAAPRPLFKPGHVVHVMPAPWRVIKVRGIPYYFHNGHFYQRKHNYFMVVPRPIGVIVYVTPTGYVIFR